ncbi:hypothetical protein HOC13_03780 [Candidatus Woesearchaeota archaeon]|nr:hypothetical protein [Candidatus Woesearchaeota archaeon]
MTHSRSWFLFSRFLANGKKVTGAKSFNSNKCFIIDQETIITGSMNPTGGGDTRNDENILIIKDKDLAEKFMEEFEKVYAEAKEFNKMK